MRITLFCFLSKGGGYVRKAILEDYAAESRQAGAGAALNPSEAKLSDLLLYWLASP